MRLDLTDAVIAYKKREYNEDGIYIGNNKIICFRCAIKAADDSEIQTIIIDEERSCTCDQCGSYLKLW